MNMQGRNQKNYHLQQPWKKKYLGKNLGSSGRPLQWEV
jgi:hypothetical protein